MRQFSYITFGKILEDLQRGENGHEALPTLSRPTLRRLEKSVGIFDPNRQGIGKWGIYSAEEAEDLKQEARAKYKKK